MGVLKYVPTWLKVFAELTDDNQASKPTGHQLKFYKTWSQKTIR
tara:strand:+ start:1436 stop:1567 length:132 start_codon:yes stop_codon:yes gene_type:complete